MDQAEIFSLLSRNAQFVKKSKPLSREPQIDHSDLPEEQSEILKLFKIRLKGNNPPASLLLSFSSLPPTRFPLLSNIESSRFKEPTPIQMQAIPCITTMRDVLAIAPTGSGKTAAFLLPRLVQIPQSSKESVLGVHTLVVVPTHELADQIVREHEWLTNGFPRNRKKACTLGKDNEMSVCNSLQGKSFHALVVSTPLVLVKLLNSLEVPAHVSCIVFDECDRLFEDTFVEQTDEILSKLSSSTCQRLMFSATLPAKVEQLANTILRDAFKIVVGGTPMQQICAAETIEQTLIYAGSNEGKFLAFNTLLAQGKLVPPVLIFVEEKSRARDVSKSLFLDHKVRKVDAIHGERAPAARDALVQKFREGELWFLVATEVLARGIDFRGVNTVLNWDLPHSAVSYVHRIGRCGRAGRRGTSISFFTDEDLESHLVRGIANVVKQSGGIAPEWVLNLKKRAWNAPKRKKMKDVESDADEE